MGRKRNAVNSIAEFFDGFNSAYNTTNKVLQDAEISKISREKPEDVSGFSAADGQQLEAAANAKDADGNPLYTIGTDDKGNYTITGVNGGETGVISQRPSVRQVFMGKTYDSPLNEGQLQAEREKAMAGTMEKFGNVGGALALRNQAQQRRLTDLQISGAERADRQGARAESQQSALDAVDRQVSDFAKSLTVDADGNPRRPTDDDMVQIGRKRASLLADAGLYDHAQKTAQDTSQYLKSKLDSEAAERKQLANVALSKFATSGDDSGLIKLYNEFYPDGVNATAIRKSGNNVIVERDNGKHITMPIDQFVASVNQLTDSDALAKNITQSWQRDIQQSQLGISRAQLGIAQGAAGRAQGEYDQRQAMLKASAAYEAARQKGDQEGMNAALIDITRNGGQGPGAMDANAPAEVKLANAYVKAGLAKTMAEGLQLATQSKDASPERVRQDIFKAALTANMGNVEAAKKTTDEALGYLGAAPVSRTQAASAAPPAQAIDYLKKNPNLAADFDAKYGKGAAAKVLGK